MFQTPNGNQTATFWSLVWNAPLHVQVPKLPELSNLNLLSLSFEFSIYVSDSELFFSEYTRLSNVYTSFASNNGVNGENVFILNKPIWELEMQTKVAMKVDWGSH